jgi:hypothetical protein
MGFSTNFDTFPHEAMTQTDRPERTSCELLRAVARLSNPLDAGPISLAAARVQDWDRLLALAYEHRMSALLYQALQEIEAPVPTSARQRLKAEYSRNAVQSLANAAELIDLLQVFDRKAISAMPMKGVVLAASAYGNLTARPAGDLDILIHFEKLQAATGVMLERGYCLVTPLGEHGIPVANENHQYQFERRSDGMVVELHWELDFVFGKFQRKLGMEWACRDRQTTLVAGAHLPNMNPELTLLMLCMHGSKHVWLRMIWIRDVAEHIASHPGLDWNRAIFQAKRSGLWRALAVGVLLARSVSGASVPDAVRQRFEADRVAARLAQKIEQDLFLASGIPPRGPLPYGISLLSPRDRLKLIFSLDAWRPNKMDFAAVRLPGPLRPLYWLVRPARILWKLLVRF